MGVTTDFSAAQIKGFKAAFKKTFDNEDSVKYLKGCYMHYMQSVQQIVLSRSIVPAEKVPRFLFLVRSLRETADKQVFLKTILELSEEFSNCRKWLKWWLQPTISSMIFRRHSKQHVDLWNHSVRTTNALESYHAALYLVMEINRPLSDSLRYVLQYIKSDGSSLYNFYHKNIVIKYMY